MRISGIIPKFLRAAVELAVAFFAFWPGMAAQTGSGVAASLESDSQPLVRGPVSDAERVTLRGNVHPMARRQFDLGAVDDSFPLDRLYLALKRSPAQERALANFLREAHTAGTEDFHKWLTPSEFGARFGASDSDIAAVTAWLESHGLRVNHVHPGRIAIEFSGSAGQVREAFRTAIDRYGIPNARTGEVEAQFANAADPQIPAALAAVVAGISPMHSFHGRPMIQVAGRTSYNKKTHEAQAEWTYSGSGQGVVYELAPSDFAVQYDVASVYKAGTNGAGVSIGVLSASNIDLSLVQAYQSFFSLPANLPTVVVDGNDPGVNSAAAEAYLDVEESGAVAPGAKVILYASEGSVVTDPLLTSGLRALEDNQVSVISMSYGLCEAALGASGNALWSQLWQEAAAQGITAVVATGDSGSAGCDSFDAQAFAVSGLAVNGMASTPYNIAVGGTDFYYSNYAVGGSALITQIATYWSSTASNGPAVSLLKVAPEQVWNESFGLNASDNGKYDVDNSAILAGSGGASSAAIYPTMGPVTGYPKPAWQAGAGVPADKVRDLPDVSLFAGDGPNFVYYPICASPGDCVNMSSAGVYQITSAGGSSAAAPALAGIMALVNQAAKSRQGQADYVFYGLAAKTLTTKPFRDITVGGNAVPCLQGSTNCVLATTGPAKGSYAENGYAAAAGYDRASGLGTVDVANLIANWNALTFRTTTTTLSVTPTTFAHGTTVSATATVAPVTGTGTPTGSIGLVSNDLQAYSNALDFFTLSGAKVTGSLDNLPGGTYQVVADYSGDSVFTASASAPVTVTVAKEACLLTATGWVLNPADGSLYPLQAGMAIPYGSGVYLDAQPQGVNEKSSTLQAQLAATGAVTFTDTVGTTNKTSVIPLNSEGLAEWVPATLAVGVHKASATYAGDGSYNSCSAASAATFTVFKGTTTIQVKPMETSVAAGSNVTVDVVMYSDFLGLSGTLPTGSITVTLGSQTLAVASPFKNWGATGSATQEAVVTLTKVPAGILPLMASYSGDVNWYGTASFFGSVQSLATLPAPAVTLAATTIAYTPSQTVTMTGTVTGPASGKTPTGSLYFTWEDGSASYAGALVPKTANSAAYTLSFPASVLANGTNAFVATFQGDANYSAQSSAPLLVTLNGSDFSIITSMQEVAIAKGGSGTGTVLISPVNAFAGTVAVTCTTPTGITCTPATAAPTVGTGVSDVITIKPASTVAAGVYPAVVTATGGGHVHNAQILVAVH